MRGGGERDTQPRFFFVLSLLEREKEKGRERDGDKERECARALARERDGGGADLVSSEAHGQDALLFPHMPLPPTHNTHTHKHKHTHLQVHTPNFLLYRLKSERLPACFHHRF
jgi:hypothetical protein